MEQYLQALRDREDVSEEVLLELEERFKVVEEEVIIAPIEPTEIEILQQENKLLKGQVLANADVLEFQEEVIFELIMKVYD